MYKTNSLSPQTKATLEILIRQIQDVYNKTSYTDEGLRIMEVVDEWIKRNDLHPENVTVLEREKTK